MNFIASTPLAIIELDPTGFLRFFNRTAQTLFSLSTASLGQAKFDYRHYFHLPTSLPLAQLANKTVVIEGERYFLQTINEHDRLIFILQPFDYLASQLAAKQPLNEQAFDVFVIKSKGMQKLIEQARAFSRQREPLLITGATGTGKELLAQACHQYSQRGDQIFLGLNCAALPEEVVESELYGYAAGAYPGATEHKKGFFEQANGGSVLLYGIDEMSFQMQTKLLRFISEGTFRRVGEDQEVRVDVRIICATKKDLFSLVEQGTFREDLYYRLNVLSLNIPPLCDRREDMLALTDLFINEFTHKQSIDPIIIDEDVLPLLQRYNWPGNVRQLKNVLYSASAQLTSARLTANDIALPVSQHDPLSSNLQQYDFKNKSLDELVKQFERTILVQLYQEYPSTRKLSKRLGISHTAVANKLRDYGINNRT